MSQVIWLENTELVERSLRRRAGNKGCCLQKNGCDYTIVKNNEPIVTVDDEDCWSVLESL